MINTQVYDFWHVNCVRGQCRDLSSPPWSQMQTLSMSVRMGSELHVPSAMGWQGGEETCCGHPGSLEVFWQLSLDKELIDFGSYTVGETAIRTITLTNTGGLGTKFRFLLASETCEMDTSQSVLKLVSVPLLLVNAVAAQPRAARGISCPKIQSHECEVGHESKDPVDVSRTRRGGRTASSPSGSAQTL